MLGMNAHALGVRHDVVLGRGQPFMEALARGIATYLEAIGSDRVVPVINLQSDVDHPTQTLADLCWLRQHFGGALAGRVVAVTWAYSPSYAKPLSVPQGLVMLLPRFGMHVRLAHPPGYPLLDACIAQAEAGARAGGGRFEIVESMDAAFEGADVVYPKSWGPMALMQERVQAADRGDEAAMADIERRALAHNAQHRDWCCDTRRMARTRQALYMHCLPADIGAEVTADVFARARLDVTRQAHKKLYVIMALLASSGLRDLPARLRAAVKQGG